MNLVQKFRTLTHEMKIRCYKDKYNQITNVIINSYYEIKKLLTCGT